MSKRLVNFIESENLLYNLQFGFRKKHSTCLALITLIEKITSELENGNLVLGVFLDYSKAFDCVNHPILISKLHYYGIRGKALDWFQSYLDDNLLGSEIANFTITIEILLYILSIIAGK